MKLILCSLMSSMRRVSLAKKITGISSLICLMKGEIRAKGRDKKSVKKMQKEKTGKPDLKFKVRPQNLS